MSLPIHTHTFVFNPHSDGGEQIILTTYFYKESKTSNVYTNQILTINSYLNSVSVNTAGLFEIDTLERLISELKGETDKAKVISCLTSP